MKTVAIILAGGVGKRMQSERPKQFLFVKRKPIIAYTIQDFQKNKSIDTILIVCVSNWISWLTKEVKKLKLDKVKYIIPGGETGHDSSRNAIFFLKDKLSDNDTIVIHDAARPILPQKTIDEMLGVSLKYGNASCAIPCHETLIFTENQISGTTQLDRSKVMRVQTPQAYNFKMAKDIYEKAEKDNKHDFVYADTLAIYYGYKIFFSKGFSNNIKITTKDALSLFKSLLRFSDNELLSF